MKLINIPLLAILLTGVILVSGYIFFELPTKTPTQTSTPPSRNFYQVIFEELDLQCLGTGGAREFVARTQAEYQHFIDTSPDLHPNPFLPCVDYEFPVINFSQKTLLGRTITGGGCTSEVKKDVLRNDYEQTVIYSITTIFTGTCERAITDNNFILVPKIPEDYTIKFEVVSS